MLYEEWEENDEEKIPVDELPYGHPDRQVLSKRGQMPIRRGRNAPVTLTLILESTLHQQLVTKHACNSQ